MKKRTFNTLFMIESVDGKISTGATDSMDFDKDLPKIKGVKEGLQQYYALERRTDIHSLNTGRVMAKIGVNKRKEKPKKIPVSFIIIDNKPHLTKKGVIYLSQWVKKLYLVTTNKNHPAYTLGLDNVEIIYYPKSINFKNLFVKLYNKYGAKRITIQSGGTLNAILLREGLIDMISIVIAPLLIGGMDTMSLIGGKSLKSVNELSKVKALKIKECKKLKNSYIHIKYAVINEGN